MRRRSGSSGYSAAAFHRREIAISRRLPGEVPAPRLLDAYDDGVWVVLAFEDIPGRLPTQPWLRDELDRVLTAVTEQARILTPSPVDEAILAKPWLGGWPALADDAGGRALKRLSSWAAPHCTGSAIGGEHKGPEAHDVPHFLSLRHLFCSPKRG